MEIEIKSWINGAVLFSHDCENNTIKTTLELGVSLGISFNNAKLNYAKLNDAELNNAELNNAELNDAELNNAELNNAELNGAIGNMKEVRSFQIEKYKITFTSAMLFIGCKGYSHQEWAAFSDKDISRMATGAVEFWTKWKSFIFRAIALSFGEYPT